MVCQKYDGRNTTRLQLTMSSLGSDHDLSGSSQDNSFTAHRVHSSILESHDCPKHTYCQIFPIEKITIHLMRKRIKRDIEKVVSDHFHYLSIHPSIHDIITKSLRSFQIPHNNAQCHTFLTVHSDSGCPRKKQHAARGRLVRYNSAGSGGRERVARKCLDRITHHRYQGKRDKRKKKRKRRQQQQQQQKQSFVVMDRGIAAARSSALVHRVFRFQVRAVVAFELVDRPGEILRRGLRVGVHLRSRRRA